MGMHPLEQERYDACEHEDIADNVKLQFYGRGRYPELHNANKKNLNFIRIKSHRHNTRSERLRSTEEISLTFGKISALAGDFYGVPEQPITLEEETELYNITYDRKQRAIAAFNTIGEWKAEHIGKIKTTLMRNLSYLNAERTQIENKGKIKKTDIYGVIAYHGFEDAICENYKNEKIEIEKMKNSFPIFMMKDLEHGPYLLKLLINNYDHFQPYAKVTFEVFHALALEEAKKARNAQLTPNEKNQILETAYALEAFGCHFLGDCFASGHMRTPRRALPKSTSFDQCGNLLDIWQWIVTKGIPNLSIFELGGHLLCNKMHDEDNEHGLRVTSRYAIENGKPSWMAYGDKMLHNTNNITNFRFAQKAVQLAVDEVFRASQSTEPEMTTNHSKVFDLIPYIDTKEKNNTPMFQVRPIDEKVCRRTELGNLQCQQQLNDNWTAAETLTTLALCKPSNMEIEKETKKGI